jgi:hypothetical protein
VFLANPVARAKIAIPPRPMARASVPAHNLRIRSVNEGTKARNLARISFMFDMHHSMASIRNMVKLFLYRL